MEPTITELRARLEAAVRGPALDGPLTIRVLFNRFMDHARSYYPKRDHTSEVDNFDDALAVPTLLYGDSIALDFGPIQMQACRKLMIERGLTRGSINARVRKIRHVIRWAVTMELLPVANLKALEAVEGIRRGRTPARESKPVQPVPRGVVDATVRELKPTVAAMVRLQLLTAMRPGEVLSMRGSEIDRRGEVWLYQPTVHKCSHHDKPRIIPIGPHGIEIVNSRLNPSYLFTTPAGNPYSIVSYERAITRAAARAGVAHWSPNRLRHTAATMIREQFGLDTCQAVLGHARIETSQVYAERMNHLAAQAALKVG